MDGELQEDVIDRCIQRLLQGEPLDRVLRSYPDQQPQLRAALQPAIALLQSNTPDPSPRSEYAAMSAMMRQVHVEADRPELPGVIRWLGTLRARPLAYQALAVVAAIALFGSIGLGASAATGAAPEPVRTFLGISSSPPTVRLNGPIVTVDSQALVVRTATGDRSIEISAQTMIRRGNQRIDAANLSSGEAVLVTASEMRDGSLVAREVRAALPPTPTDTAVIGVPALSQPDDSATDTPNEDGAGEGDHGSDHGGNTTSTPAPDDRHGEDEKHAETPAASATPKGDEEHSTSTPEHAEKTSEPEHGDPTPTPSGSNHDD
jgi:hypothetical protein